MVKKANWLVGPKVEGLIQTESVLESTLAFCAMIDPRVQSIEPQPVTFDLLSGKRYQSKDVLLREHLGDGYQPKPYTPDFRVRLQCGSERFLEAKHRRFLEEKPEYLTYPGIFSELGLKLVLVTDELLQGPLEYNARMLWPHVSQQLAPTVAKRFKAIEEEAVEFRRLLQWFSQSEILTAILQGLLATNMVDTRVGPKTALTSAGGKKTAFGDSGAMTPLVKQYDGRILMIDDQAHEVLGPVHGRPAVSLRAPDGIQHEISVQDFQFQVSIGNVLDPETDGLRNRHPNAEEQFEVAFRKAVIEQTVALEAEGVTWPQRLLIMRERFERDPKFSKRKKKFPSERTIQVWMKQNLRHGVHGLRDRTFESGNRSSRHDVLFEEILY